MLVDVHAHFYHPAGARADWAERNASRLRAGEKVGITWHVASILGSWGRTSPTYFPSPADVAAGNDALLRLQHQHPSKIRSYACVNPNFAEHAVEEIRRCLSRGMIGVKLAASRRADDPVLDPVCQAAPRARVTAHLAAPSPGMAGPGGVRRRGARRAGPAAPRRAVHPRSHQWGR